MRIRQIKPEFFKHAGLGEISRDARLLFIGLWCMADSEGRLDDNSRLIKSELFPFDEGLSSEQVGDWLNELASVDEKVLTRYVLGKKQYIQINNFSIHQHLMGNEKNKKSRRPSPPENGSAIAKEAKVRTQYVPSTTDIRSNGVTELRKKPPLSPLEGEPKQKAQRKTKIAENWEPKQELIDWALAKDATVDIQYQSELFRNHFLANGKTMLDWDRAWQTWIARSKEFSRPNLKPTYSSPSYAENPKIKAFLAAKSIRNKFDGTLIDRSELEKLDGINGVIFWQGRPLDLGDYEPVA